MVCQLRFCFTRSASFALISSCFFACSVLDDTGGQYGLRRDGRPSFAACSVDIRQSATTNDAGSSTPRTHQGTCSPPRRRVQGVCSYCSSYAAGASVRSLFVQWKSVSAIHMRIKTTASLRASATLASLAPLRFAILIAQPRKADQRP
jgi:hypothetical protein